MWQFLLIHHIFDKIQKKSPLPLISIVKSTVDEAKTKNYNKILLTGTIFTMNNDFYKKEFKKRNIQCICPNDKDKKIINDIIFQNLENGIILNEDKSKFIEIIEKIILKENIDCVVLDVENYL